MDQSPSTCVGGQKTATVIFNSECPKVVDRFRFRDDILTLTLPIPLFQRMEKEANDSVFQIPSWKRLVGRRFAH